MQGTVTLYTIKYLNVICKCIIWSKRAAGQKGRSKRAHVKITNKRPFLTDLAIYYRECIVFPKMGGDSAKMWKLGGFVH